MGQVFLTIFKINSDFLQYTAFFQNGKISPKKSQNNLHLLELNFHIKIKSVQKKLQEKYQNGIKMNKIQA